MTILKFSIFVLDEVSFRTSITMIKTCFGIISNTYVLSLVTIDFIKFGLLEMRFFIKFSNWFSVNNFASRVLRQLLTPN